ncbi:hypothetical protein QR680_007326 [Steinernema hermaphroditum]|uniref:DUF155 domain-containing protein n=1 Tax=Steinernema hermaphroditum TaxID=289476 RepID=A0AA39IEF9_9BILA|nr:hypothetical protein QR680_007326 [Steinernema hermaphroditum]
MYDNIYLKSYRDQRKRKHIVIVLLVVLLIMILIGILIALVVILSNWENENAAVLNVVFPSGEPGKITMPTSTMATSSTTRRLTASSSGSAATSSISAIVGTNMANRFVSSCLRASRGILTPRRVWLRSAQPLSTSSLQCDPSTDAQQLRPPRQVRKRRALTSYYETTQAVPAQEVIAVSIAESLDLAAIFRSDTIGTVYNATFVDDEFDEALHIVPKEKYIIEKNALRDMFIFSDGVVVFWNISPMEREQILRNLERYSGGQYSEKMATEETDSMAFELMDNGRTRISNDTVMLNVAQHDGRQRSHHCTLERYAFSHGFAASVKLAIWESQLNDYAEPLAQTTKDLTRGVIPWRRKEALKKTGEFAALRHSINLNTCLLNDDFYWERPELETHYKQALRYFAVASRLRKVNNRLDYCEEIVRLIDNMLSHRHASTLEWMIIILIVIEVFFDVWHFLDKSPKPVVVVPAESSTSD